MLGYQAVRPARSYRYGMLNHSASPPEQWDYLARFRQVRLVAAAGPSGADRAGQPGASAPPERRSSKESEANNAFACICNSFSASSVFGSRPNLICKPTTRTQVSYQAISSCSSTLVAFCDGNEFVLRIGKGKREIPPRARTNSKSAASWIALNQQVAQRSPQPITLLEVNSWWHSKITIVPAPRRDQACGY